MTNKIFLFSGISSENILYNPFFPETEVSWSVPDGFPEEAALQKDSNGHLRVHCETNSQEIYPFTCERHDGQMSETYPCQFLFLPEILEIPRGKTRSIVFPDSIGQANFEVDPPILTWDFDPEKSELKLTGLQEGFAGFTCSWGVQNVYSVKVDLKIRVMESASQSAEPETLAFPDAGAASTGSFSASEPPPPESAARPDASGSLAPPEPAPESAPPPASSPGAKATPSVPELKGLAMIVVSKKTDPSTWLVQHPIGTGKSLIVGRASSSSALAVDIDLTPFLSQGNRDLCSRNQLRVFLSQKRVYVKNIGGMEVQLDDNTLLLPQEGTFLAPGRTLEIANEIFIGIQEKI